MFRKIKGFICSSIISIFLIFSVGSKYKCSAFDNLIFVTPIFQLPGFQNFPDEVARFTQNQGLYSIFNDLYNGVSYFFDLLNQFSCSHILYTIELSERKSRIFQKEASERNLKVLEYGTFGNVAQDLFYNLFGVIRDLQIELQPINGGINQTNLGNRMISLHYWLENVLIPFLRTLFPSFSIRGRIDQIPIPAAYDQQTAIQWLNDVRNILFTYIPMPNQQNQANHPIDPNDLWLNNFVGVNDLTNVLLRRAEAAGKLPTTNIHLRDTCGISLYFSNSSFFINKNKRSAVNSCRTAEGDQFLVFILRDLLLLLPPNTTCYTQSLMNNWHNNTVLTPLQTDLATLYPLTEVTIPPVITARIQVPAPVITPTRQPTMLESLISFYENRKASDNRPFLNCIGLILSLYCDNVYNYDKFIQFIFNDMACNLPLNFTLLKDRAPFINILFILAEKYLKIINGLNTGTLHPNDKSEFFDYMLALLRIIYSRQQYCKRYFEIPKELSQIIDLTKKFSTFDSLESFQEKIYINNINEIVKYLCNDCVSHYKGQGGLLYLTCSTFVRKAIDEVNRESGHNKLSFDEISRHPGFPLLMESFIRNLGDPKLSRDKIVALIDH